MSDITQTVKYESVIPVGAPDTKFQVFNTEKGEYEFLADFKLIRSIDELKEYAKSCEGLRIAVDTETTGLTYQKDFIVGFSISKSAYDGVYVPIRHQIRLTTRVKEIKRDAEGNPILTKTGKNSMHTVEYYDDRDNPLNLPAKEALDILFNDIMMKSPMVLMHNSAFDLNMLRQEGYNVVKARTFDTMCLSYIYDPEARLNGLKQLAERLLGRKVQHFDEVTGGDDKFRFTDPEQSYIYACCHDKDTEVLTENGWVLWSEYNGVDKLATVDINTNLFEYQTPVGITKYKYDGEMMLYKSKTLDFCVTPNHKMLVYPAQDVSRTAIRKEAKDMNQYEKLYMQPIGKKGGKDFTFQTTQGSTLTSNQIAKLTALVLADGWTKNRTKESRNCSVGISLSVEKHFEEITTFLNSLPLKANYYKSTSSEKVRQWVVSDKALWTLLHPYCKDGARKKYIPAFIKEMNTQDIQDFIHFYNITDGHTCYNTHYLYTTSEKMKDDLMELLLMAGFRSDFIIRKITKDYSINDRIIKAENCAPVYHIKYNTERKSVGIKRYTGNMQMVPYNDYVYCAEVPNHSLVTRRNGKILISGNCDTANTFGIYDKLYPMVKTLLKQSPEKMIINGKPYNVLVEDNNLIRAFVDYYDHCEMLVDKNAAIEYKRLIDKETEDTITSIYSYFGIGQFSLSTGSKEFKEVMNKFKFETGHRTKKGAISFGKKGVETMKRALNNFKNNIWSQKNKIVFINSQLYWNQGATPEVKTTAFNLGKFITTYGAPYFEFKASKSETSTHLTIKNLNGKKMTRIEFFQQLAYMYKEEKRKLEILQLILRYTSLQKALNSYVNKLTESDSCRMRYRLTGTKSSRLSSGNGAKSDKRKNFYFSDLSAQTLTKPKSQWYKGEPAQPGDPRAVHGWVFTPVTNEYYMEHSHDEVIVEGFKQEANIRSCFVAPKGRLVCSMDYNSEELVAIALLSGDSVMLDGFRRKEDPHKTTAIGIWGAENYNVNVRKKAKAVNFLMSYQGGAGTLSETLEIPFKEAQDIIDKYKNTYHECVHWKEMEVIKMYNNKGLIYTRFGRPRQLQPWLDIANRMGDDGIRAYAERSVCSHHVQGFCGDICRFDMVKFYNTIVCNPVHRKYVDFLSFIHDELNTTIDEHRIEEYVRILEDIMVFPYLDPTLPISTGLELGHKLGDLYPFTWNDPKARDFLVPERSYFE